MNRITAKESEAYVASGGEHCPKCNSEDIDSTGNFDFLGDGLATLPMCCSACGQTWLDAYQLIGADDVTR